MPKFKASRVVETLKAGDAKQKEIEFKLTELEYEMDLETLSENQMKWVRILRGAYSAHGNLTPVQLQVLWDIYDKVFQ